MYTYEGIYRVYGTLHIVYDVISQFTIAACSFFLQNRNISHNTQLVFEVSSLTSAIFLLLLFVAPLYSRFPVKRWHSVMDEMTSKNDVKGIIWPEVIRQSSLKSCCGTRMKAFIFGPFNSTQQRLITVMALSRSTPWKHLMVFVCLVCTITANTHAKAQSTDGCWVF